MRVTIFILALAAGCMAYFASIGKSIEGIVVTFSVFGLTILFFGIRTHQSPKRPRTHQIDWNKLNFDVVLAEVGDTTRKVPVIKVVREITGLGLKESKDVVDKAPQMVKPGVPRDEALEMLIKLEREGATVELK